MFEDKSLEELEAHRDAIVNLPRGHHDSDTAAYLRKLEVEISKRKEESFDQKLSRGLKQAIKDAVVANPGYIPTNGELRRAGVYGNSPEVPDCPDNTNRPCGAKTGKPCPTPSGMHYSRRDALIAKWRKEASEVVQR